MKALRLALVASAALAILQPLPALASTTTGAQMPTAHPPAGNCITMGAYPAVADSGVQCSSGAVTMTDPTNHGSMKLVPSVAVEPTAPAILNNTSAQPVLLTKGVAVTATDAGDFKCYRDANYSGGTFGFVNPCLYSYTISRAGTKSFEWSFLARNDNYGAASDAAQDVAAYFQGRKYGTGSTWADTVELIDYGANPTAGSVTDEHDLQATGGDNNLSRVIQDDFCESQDGNAAVCGYGMRINADTHAEILQGIYYNGSFNNGINLANASFASGAIVLGDNQELCLQAFCNNYFFHAGGSLYFHTPSGNVFSFSDGGQFSASTLSIPGAALVGSLASSGNVSVPTGNSLCLDGTSCTRAITDISGTFALQVGGTTYLSVNPLNGNVGTEPGGTFSVGFSVGVSCSAGTVNTSTMTVVGGIVTHC